MERMWDEITELYDRLVLEMMKYYWKLCHIINIIEHNFKKIIIYLKPNLSNVYKYKHKENIHTLPKEDAQGILPLRYVPGLHLEQATAPESDLAPSGQGVGAVSLGVGQ